MTKTKIGLLLGHNNDLVFVDGRLALVTGADLVRQRWQQRARSFKGEWVLDKNAGIPYFQEIFKKGTTERRIKEIFRNMSNATEGVLRTIDISPGNFDRKTRKLSDLKVRALIDGEEGEDLASFVFGGDVYPIGTDFNKPIVPRPDDPISVSWFRYVQNNTSGTRWTDYAQFGSGAGIGLADGAHGIQILNTGVRSIALSATQDDKRTGDLIFTGAGVSQDGNTFTFSGGAVAYTASRGIQLDPTGTDFRHTNAVTAKTEALYPIAYNAQGHITASGSAVTSLKNPNNLVLKVKSGTTEGTNLYTYDGSAAKTLDIKQGSNITLTEAAGSVTIAATDTTYTSSLGISLVGTDFRHSNSVTAKTEALYPIAYDAQGHITASGSAVTSLKNPNNLVLKIKSGTTEGTDLYTYDGSATKALDIRQGSNITLTEGAGILTIAATDTTYPLKQGYVAFGNETGITGESALFWDNTNKRLGLGTTTPETVSRLHIVGGGITTSPSGIRSDTYRSNNYGIIQLTRSLNNTIGSHTAVSTQTLGALSFSGSDGSAFVSGAEIRAVCSSAVGDWSTTGNQAADLLFYTKNAGTLAGRMRLHSEGGVTYGTDGDATRDWQKGHFLASQRLDGSTAGSSQSIVAMTLGLRTTTTTANQVLKLTSSGSVSPLTLQSGYVYSFLVNITATFESGDKKGYRSEVYHVEAFYNHNIATLMHSVDYTGVSGNIDVGNFTIYSSSSTPGLCEIKFTPSAYCSVDNPINVLATIYGGTKIKTNKDAPCS